MKLLLHHDSDHGGHAHGDHGAHAHGHHHPQAHGHHHPPGYDAPPKHWHLRAGLRAALALWWPGILTLCALAWLASGIRVVGPAERGVVRHFGKVVDDRVVPGIRFGLPVGIERLTRIQTSKARRVAVGGGSADSLTGGLPDPSRSQFFSGDRNIVDIQLSIQYVIDDPAKFLFGTTDPDEAVRLACESALCQITAGLPVDEILTLRKAEIQIRVRQMAQATLDLQGVGVKIMSVSQERSAPPEKVADAFRSVTSARADRDRLIAEAEGYREDLLPKARGEAASISERARSDAYQTIALAEARARRFERILEQAGPTPVITRQRMHAEVIEEILLKTRKVILKPGAATDVRVVEEAP